MASVAVGPSERLIVALDTPSVESAREVVERLGSEISFYKIGLQLAFVGGIGLAEQLKEQGKRIFLDLKLFDIPSTIYKATSDLLRLEVDFLTINGGNLGALQAACQACRDTDSPTKILCVTLLTSLGQKDISGGQVTDYVVERAGQAAELGAAGVVASGLEAKEISAAHPALTIVSPGIRLPSGNCDEHKRPLSPELAIRSGADFLVVGRPIIDASDPRQAARGFVAEIERAMFGNAAVP